MLKLLLLLGAVALGLFLFACLAIGVIMLILIVTTKPEPEERPSEPDRATTSDVEPSRDERLFARLASEMMAYATRPYVTTIVDVNGAFLLTTVSDAFGRRVYAESRRRASKTIVAVICVYEEGRHVPAVAAMTEIPATRADWPNFFAELQDVRSGGPRMTFRDHHGRHREVRIPKTRRHHA